MVFVNLSSSHFLITVLICDLNNRNIYRLKFVLFLSSPFLCFYQKNIFKDKMNRIQNHHFLEFKKNYHFFLASFDYLQIPQQQISTIYEPLLQFSLSNIFFFSSFLLLLLLIYLFLLFLDFEFFKHVYFRFPFFSLKLIYHSNFYIQCKIQKCF